MSCAMLKQRSAFSNHPIIDTQWEPDPEQHWLRQTWEHIVFFLLRTLFHFQIVR